MGRLAVIGGVTADYDSLIARTPEEFRAKNGVDVLTGHRVLEVDAGRRRVKVTPTSRAGARS